MSDETEIKRVATFKIGQFLQWWKREGMFQRCTRKQALERWLNYGIRELPDLCDDERREIRERFAKASALDRVL